MHVYLQWQFFFLCFERGPDAFAAQPVSASEPATAPPTYEEAVGSAGQPYGEKEELKS